MLKLFLFPSRRLVPARKLPELSRTMATASKVELTTDVGKLPEYYRPGISSDQAKKASELLQENHDQHHIFFSSEGFHNHTAHHILAIWALNASTESLQKGYDGHKTNQRPVPDTNSDVLKDLEDPSTFVKHLGPRDNYGNYLVFFRKQIEKDGWQKVLQKYLFDDNDRAETMLVRMFGGFLHPIIHLGYGVEFLQPAIMAEGLAQAACHEEWIGKLLLPAEKAAKDRSSQQSKTIAQLLDEIHADKKLREAPHWADGNKVRDGILVRAGEEMIHYASQFHVKPEELEEKTAEMTNAVCYYTAGAQHPPNMVMYDFYFMHCVNASIFFSAFLKQDWLSDANKVRLLEWKVRMDIGMYASRRAPDIKMDEIRNYKPKKPSGWDGIEDRVCQFYDDGHASKLIRALAHGQQICKPYEDKEEFRIKQDDWLQMGHMAIDSVEDTERFPNVSHWVRSAGFEEAWENIPVRAQL